MYSQPILFNLCYFVVYHNGILWSKFQVHASILSSDTAFWKSRFSNGKIKPVVRPATAQRIFVGVNSHLIFLQIQLGFFKVEALDMLNMLFKRYQVYSKWISDWLNFAQILAISEWEFRRFRKIGFKNVPTPLWKWIYLEKVAKTIRFRGMILLCWVFYVKGMKY